MLSTSSILKYTAQDVQESIKHIMKEEGFEPEAYPDPFSPLGIEMRKPAAKRQAGYTSLSGAPWTIGYGRTGPDVQRGVRTTKDQEIFWLKFRIKEELDFLQKLGVPPCAGLVGLVYNVGKNAFQKSRACKALQQRRWEDAYVEILDFNRAGGRVRAGLTRRREKEVALLKDFLSRNLHGNPDAKS